MMHASYKNKIGRAAVIAAALTVNLLCSGALAQNRTRESAVTFINLFMQQKTPRYRYFHKDTDGSDLSGFSRSNAPSRLMGARSHARYPENPCRMQLTTDGNQISVDWAEARVHRYTFEGTFPTVDAPLPFITLERGGELGTLAIWAGDDNDTRRLQEAMTFLAESCNAMSQTGF